jgi:transglutaminase-like putative cysteine protease
MNFLLVFRTSIYCLCLVSFLALFQTGELNPAASIGGFVCFAIVPFRQQLPFLHFKPLTWTIISVLAFVGCLFYILRVEVLNGIVYFLIFLQFQKLLSELKNRDYLQLFAISFFQMVAAAAMTLNMSFGFLFLFFLLFSAATLSLLTCKRESDRTLIDTDENRGILLQHKLGGLYGVTLSGMSVGLFIVTVFLFLYIPRLSATNFFFSFRTKPQGQLSGFSDEMEFGEFSPIELDDTLLMRVRTDSTRDLSSIRLRGLSLSYFDGRSWKARDPAQTSIDDQPYYSSYSDFDDFEERILKRPRRYRHYNPALRAIRHTGTVQLEPGQTSYLFVPDIPDWFNLPSRSTYQYNKHSASVELRSVPNAKMDYKIAWTTWEAPWEQIVATATAAEQNPENWEHDQIRELSEQNYRNIQVPTDMPGYYRIGELGVSLVGDEEHPLQKARILRDYFHNEFEYSLDPNIQNPDRFIEEFLFENRAGHCEFFATSMAILCRLQGVPARVVNGFYTDEISPLGNYFMVRQEHAHAWVEVFDPGLGWVSFDPTPPSGIGIGRFEKNSLLQRFQYFADIIKTQWYDRVVDYNFFKQRQLFRRTDYAADRVRDTAVGLVGGAAKQKNTITVVALVMIIGGIFLYLRARRTKRVVLHGISRDWARLRQRLLKRLKMKRSADALSDRELLQLARENDLHANDIARAVRLHERYLFANALPSDADSAWLRKLSRSI